MEDALISLRKTVKTLVEWY